MKNFDEYRNFYENDAPLGLNGPSDPEPEFPIKAELPAPKTYKEYAIGKVLGLGAKVEMPTKSKEITAELVLGERLEDPNDGYYSDIFISETDMRKFRVYEFPLNEALNYAYFPDGTHVDADTYTFDPSNMRLYYDDDGMPTITGSVFVKWTEEVPVYEPKTFLEHAMDFINRAEFTDDDVALFWPVEYVDILNITGTAIEYNNSTVFSLDGDTPMSFEAIKEEFKSELLIKEYLNNKEMYILDRINESRILDLTKQHFNAGDSIHIVIKAARSKIFPKTNIEIYFYAALPEDIRELLKKSMPSKDNDPEVDQHPVIPKK